MIMDKLTIDETARLREALDLAYERQRVSGPEAEYHWEHGEETCLSAFLDLVPKLIGYDPAEAIKMAHRDRCAALLASARIAGEAFAKEPGDAAFLEMERTWDAYRTAKATLDSLESSF
jgi:hypothetical protein